MDDLDLEELARLAREQPLAQPSATIDDSIVRHAMLAGRARHARMLRTRATFTAGALVAIAAAAMLWVRAWDGDLDRHRSAEAEHIELSLSSGDRLITRGQARFQVESDVVSDRRIRLSRGAMLFDIAPLGAGSRFELSTPHGTVRVLGTVFAVEVSDAGMSVRVFEGRVEVFERAADPIELGAGDVYREAAASAESRALEVAGYEIAAQRMQRVAQRTAPSPVERRLAGVATSAPADASTVVPRRDGDLEPVGDAIVDATAEVPENVRRMPSRARENARRATRVARTASSASRDSVGRDDLESHPSIGQDVSEPAAHARDRAHDDDGARAIATATAALREGRAEDALTLARAHAHETGETADAWRMIEGDSLRRLGRHAEAVGSYVRVLEAGEPRYRLSAGFVAAELQLRRLNDPDAAALSLERSGALEPRSLLRERALALRAEIAVARSDADDLALAAREYLAEFPDGARARWMRDHTAP